MIPTSFEEETGFIDCPEGTDPEFCEPLPVYIGKLPEGHPIIISCWKITAEELEEVKKTGKIWTMVWGESTPPIAITGFSPFTGAKDGTT